MFWTEHGSTGIRLREGWRTWRKDGPRGCWEESRVSRISEHRDQPSTELQYVFSRSSQLSFLPSYPPVPHVHPLDAAGLGSLAQLRLGCMATHRYLLPSHPLLFLCTNHQVPLSPLCQLSLLSPLLPRLLPLLLLQLPRIRLKRPPNPFTALGRDFVTIAARRDITSLSVQSMLYRRMSRRLWKR